MMTTRQCMLPAKTVRQSKLNCKMVHLVLNAGACQNVYYDSKNKLHDPSVQDKT